MVSVILRGQAGRKPKHPDPDVRYVDDFLIKIIYRIPKNQARICVYGVAPNGKEHLLVTQVGVKATPWRDVKDGTLWSELIVEETGV